MLVGFVLFVWRREDSKTGRLEDWEIVSRERGRQSTISPDLSEPQPSNRPTFQPSSPSKATVILIALWLLLTSFVFVYYNVWLVQFQGRYLFPILIPIALLGVLGLRKILTKRWGWIAAGLCGIAAIIIVVGSVLGGDLDKWGILIAGGGMLVLIVRRWLPASLDRWILVIILAGLAGLSVYSLFAFIVPYLSP
jgi:hypothetical protein